MSATDWILVAAGLSVPLVAIIFWRACSDRAIDEAFDGIAGDPRLADLMGGIHGREDNT